MKGVLTTIKYKNEDVAPEKEEGAVDKLRPTIYVWTRDEQGLRHRNIITGFKPYFYASTYVESKASFILDSPEIEKWEKVKFGYSDLIRIFTYIPGQVPPLKRAIQTKFAQSYAREADVLFELRFMVDKGIRGPIDWTDTSNPVATDDLAVTLRRIYIDTEIWTTRVKVGKRLWQKEYIKCISAYDNYEKKYYTWYYNDTDLKIRSHRKDWLIIHCPSVKEMMIKFLEYVRDRDPDVITGYNVDFDLLALRKTAFENETTVQFDYLSALHDLNYSVGAPKTKRHRIRGVDWSRRGLDFDGREVIDILDLIRMIARSQLREYTLEYVVKKFLDPKEGKLKWGDKPIAPHLIELWKINPELVLKYNMHDVELVVKLDEKNDLIDFLDELRKTVGVRLEDAFSNQRMIDTEALRRRKFPLPSKFESKKKEDEEETYKGAFVVEPKVGLHQWVVCLDFRSLYPTIVRSFNIDTDSYMPMLGDWPKDKVYSFSNEDNSKTWYFRKEPRGLFPEMLDDFVALRNKIRKQMEHDPDEHKKHVLDIKQEVIKVLSNAVYGAFGYRSRKHSLECAEAITTFGQKMIKLACQTAESHGFSVVYGDTDSVFVEPGTKNYGETLNAGIALQDELCAKFPNFTTQFGIEEKNLFDITLEKVYDRFFMASKKRYTGRIIKKNGETDRDVKGLDTKRSDTSEFAGELQSRLLDALLLTQDKEKLKGELADSINKYDKETRERIGVPSAVSKPLKGGYKKTNPIQKRAAENSNKYLGTDFAYGSKPLRVYTKVPPVEAFFQGGLTTSEDERKRQIEELKPLDVFAFDETTEFPEWFKIDYYKMVTKTVKPKIDKLLEALGVPWVDIETLLRPEFQKPVRVKKAKKKKVATLDNFIGAKDVHVSH